MSIGCGAQAVAVLPVFVGVPVGVSSENKCRLSSYKSRHQGWLVSISLAKIPQRLAGKLSADFRQSENYGLCTLGNPEDKGDSTRALGETSESLERCVLTSSHKHGNLARDCRRNRVRLIRCSCSSSERSETESAELPSDEDHDNIGVRAALSLLRFYKREISPYIPPSCRYVPTCSEYAQQAYKKYGFVKGSILTAWRLARCNPLGSSGFDPPRWFGEEKPPQV